MSVRTTPPPPHFDKPFGAGMGGAGRAGRKRSILGRERRRGSTNPRISQSAVKSAAETSQFFNRANRIRGEQIEQRKQQQRKPVAPSAPKKVAPKKPAPVPNLITGEGLDTPAPYKTRMTPKRPWETGWKPPEPTAPVAPTSPAPGYPPGYKLAWFQQPVKPAHKEGESPYETDVWKSLNKKYPQRSHMDVTRHAWEDVITSPRHPLHFEISEALHKGGVRRRSDTNPSGWNPLYRFGD